MNDAEQQLRKQLAEAEAKLSAIYEAYAAMKPFVDVTLDDDRLIRQYISGEELTHRMLKDLGKAIEGGGR